MLARPCCRLLAAFAKPPRPQLPAVSVSPAAATSFAPLRCGQPRHHPAARHAPVGGRQQHQQHHAFHTTTALRSPALNNAGGKEEEEAATGVTLLTDAEYREYSEKYLSYVLYAIEELMESTRPELDVEYSVRLHPLSHPCVQSILSDQNRKAENPSLRAAS